jgi:mono/diheme cytochrome c family protein
MEAREGGRSISFGRLPNSRVAKYQLKSLAIWSSVASLHPPPGSHQFLFRAEVFNQVKLFILHFCVFVSLIAILAVTADGKERARANADAGRKLSLDACTGCHIVSEDQRFPPLLTGAPGFREIANRPNVTAESLRRTIAALPQVPRNGRMANPLLTDDQLADVAAYIITLRQDHTKDLQRRLD